MKIAKKDGRAYLIAIEDTESLEDVVMAIARASFDTARPAGISAITSFDPDARWEDVAHTVKPNLKAKSGEGILHMDYVAGRRCKTELTMGRKYLRYFPGDGREDEGQTIVFLAQKHLVKKRVIAAAKTQSHLVH